ncbi:MAG: DUF3097 family protein [Bowdeniella nasicola]|nr:DUF3097 family protein [Bowdeniella nasicola]
MHDRYGNDIFAHDPHPARPTSTPYPARIGEVVEDVESGWVGAITRIEKSGGIHLVELEDRHGVRRSFPLGAGFWVDGHPVTLTLPAAKPSQPIAPKRTASGSIAVNHTRPRVAIPSRILVEGRHDAELIQRVWGADLALEGVVVELLEGVDNLGAHLRAHQPGPHRRIGVLVDHYLPGSKETRLVNQALEGLNGREYVLVCGHPYIDVWHAIKPERVGLRKWPTIPRGVDVKVGTLQALGLAHHTQADIARGWQAILKRVRTYQDLTPELVGRVEELIDFVLADRYGA